MSGRLVVENVFAGYDRADVLNDVSLAAEPGRITCILGSLGPIPSDYEGEPCD